MLNRCKKNNHSHIINYIRENIFQLFLACWNQNYYLLNPFMFTEIIVNKAAVIFMPFSFFDMLAERIMKWITYTHHCLFTCKYDVILNNTYLNILSKYTSVVIQGYCKQFVNGTLLHIIPMQKFTCISCTSVYIIWHLVVCFGLWKF